MFWLPAQAISHLSRMRFPPHDSREVPGNRFISGGWFAPTSNSRNKDDAYYLRTDNNLPRPSPHLGSSSEEPWEAVDTVSDVSLDYNPDEPEQPLVCAFMWSQH